jgi:hypothetical protein
MLQLGHTIMEWDLPNVKHCIEWLITSPYSSFSHVIVTTLFSHMIPVDLLNRQHKPKYYRSLSLATVLGSLWCFLYECCFQYRNLKWYPVVLRRLKS